MSQEVVKKQIEVRKASWKVQRLATITETHYPDGRVVYVLKVWDEGREPFITNTFNDEAPAWSFLDRLKDSGYYGLSEDYDTEEVER